MIHIAQHQPDGALVVVNSKLVERGVGSAGVAGGCARPGTGRVDEAAAVVAEVKRADAGRKCIPRSECRRVGQYAIYIDTQAVTVSRRQRIEIPGHRNVRPARIGYGVGSRFDGATRTAAVGNDKT